MNDEELKDLFSAFDDVSAPESLKSSTLDFIMEAAAAPATPAADEAEPASQQAVKVTAVHGGKARGKWRAMRVAALAACLALALTGGVAYAYPASTVLVTQGGTTVELQVNVFGQVLSASANDGETQELIDQMGLVHTSYEDSVTRVFDSLKESNPQVPVEVVLNGVAQAVESDDSKDEPREEESESSSATDSSPLTTAGAEEQGVELPAVASEPVVSVPATAPVSAPEVVVALPEPSGVTSGNDQSGKPDGGNRSDVSESPADPVPDPVVVEPTPVTPSVEEPSEPAQPVVIDEEPGAEQEPDPAEATEAVTPAEPQPEEAVVYANTRAPRHYGDDED